MLRPDDDPRFASTMHTEAVRGRGSMRNVVLGVVIAVVGLGVLLAGVASRRPWLMLGLGSGASLVIEAVQAVLPAIGRSCDTTDWSSNSIGALVGAVLAWAAVRLASRVRRSPSEVDVALP